MIEAVDVYRTKWNEN